MSSQSAGRFVAVQPHAEDGLEPLEPRRLLAVTPLAVASVTTALGNELRITGTAGNDVIWLHRTTDGLLISNSTGFSRLWSGAVATVRISGLDGNDRIAVGSAIWTPVVLYGNAGDDTLVGGSGGDRLYGGTGSDWLSGAAGNDLLVAVGDSRYDRATGGGGLDSFWVDSSSTEQITDPGEDELLAGSVHRIAAFYGSRTSGTTTALSLSSTELASQRFVDPAITSAASGYRNFSHLPLFSRYGPRVEDVQQGELGDCYLLAALGSVAKSAPQSIRQSLADLGDGTYAVQFVSGTAKVYVRVDGDLPVRSDGYLAYAQLGIQSALWVAIYEKAWAFWRSGDGKYASIEAGHMGEVYRALGRGFSEIDSAISGTSLLQQLQAELLAGSAVTFGTIQNPPADVPVVGGHGYIVERVNVDSSGRVVSLTLRNPWGIDGAGNDGRDDGIVTITAAQALRVMWFAVISRPA
ncbi:C2 family cysteine protease [Fontivita pretiosa]|uniref:C2 family cysteine protease n=1 Tax=Fontivita pretiosa TaxID=2989684 RepID=UPI003D168C02